MSLSTHFHSVIKLTHANLNKEVSLQLGTMSFFHYSDGSKATHVYTIAGVFPAKETPEEINRLIEATTKEK